MFVITFSNPKGGTGKTTANLILAEQIAKAGGRVTILDCDPNKNIIGWGDDRQEKGRAVPYRIIKRVEEAEDFYDQMDEEQEHADYMLIDLEGTADQLSTFATQIADLVLIPMTPSYMEAKQAHRAAKLVGKMGRSIRKDIRTHLLLNRTSTAVQSGDERDMRQMLIDGGASILPVELLNRGAFNSIFKQGLTLGELYTHAEEKHAGLSEKGRERKLKPIKAAIENADAYGDAVLAEIGESADAD